MSSLVNTFYPVLNAADGWLLGAFAPAWRLAIWGMTSGGVATALYVALSNQGKIRHKKSEIEKLNLQLRNFAGEPYEAMRLSFLNLKRSLILLAQVFVPAVLSSLPVIGVILWLNTYYSFAPPRDGDVVRVELVPSTHRVTVVPATAVSEVETAPDQLAVRAHAPVRFIDAAGVIYEGVPVTPPLEAVRKQVWWNVVVGSEAGYLRPDAAVDEIRFYHPRLRVIDGLPDWLSTWELPFFASLVASALLLKVLLRIE